MIQSGLRRAVAASAAQAGDGDWIVNPVPSGIESAQPQLALVQKKFSALKKQKAFYLAGTSSENDSEPSARQIKKLLLCALCDSVVTNLFWTRVMTTIKKRCPFCHTEMEIPRSIGEQGYCQCGAYGLITLLSEAGSFFQRARKALGVDPAQTGRFMEMVDGGIVFEEKGEPVLIQWAKKPNTSH